MDVELLLEVVLKREVHEWALGCGELHAGGEAALDDGEVAGCEMAVELGDVGAHLDTVGG